VTPLTPADVKRWDADAIYGVFQVATNRAATLQTLGDSLQQVHGTLSDWHGEAGDAFRADLGKARRDIEADGHESTQVAAAVSRAEADVRAVKAELDRIEQAADGYGFTITPDWQIDAGGMKLDGAKAVFKEQLQGLLDGCKLHAHSADEELATAVRSAVGEAPVGAGAPQSPAGNQPKSLQDMLLPANPGSGDAAKGPPGPGDAGTGKPPSVEDMLLGRGERADQKPPPGSPLDLLSRIQPGATGIPAPPLKPAEIESFKALARRTMTNDGVPPDQIEARLNAVVTNTQQWLDAGAPKYIAPDGPRPPPPGFAEGFGDRWFATEQGIKDLTGQGGLDAMGNAWGGMAKGLAGKAEEYLTMGPVAPIKDAAQGLNSFLENPAYYAGEKGADAAFTAPTLMFGGEGAAIRAGIGDMADLDVYAGMTHPAHVPIGLDNPTNYHPWSESAAQDLYSAFAHGEPTAGLTQHLSDMVTHYFGDNPDRVVLGKWDGQSGGYIGEARANGGIFFDTGDPAWKALAEALDKPTEQAVVWPVNEQFLRTQMENQIGRIDYLLDTSKYSSLEDMMLGRVGSYSAMEVKFLRENAAAYGYERVGDSWVYVGRG
jgi:hypothetical protein